jgi:hypothetical protein
VHTGHAGKAREFATAQRSCHAYSGHAAWLLFAQGQRSLAAGSAIASDCTPHAGRNSTATLSLRRQAAEGSPLGAPEGRLAAFTAGECCIRLGSGAEGQG